MKACSFTPDTPALRGSPPDLRSPHYDLLDLLRAYAAHLVHGPATLAQLAAKADLPLVLLAPRTADLARLGAVAIAGQTPSGPIYAVTDPGRDLAAPSTTDRAERQLNSLPVQDQVSIAAGIMAKYARRAKAAADPTRAQLPLPEESSDLPSPTSDLRPIIPADAGYLL
jgi:pyruvate/2-oxoglutarate dehydrogenase complex dihydrolipoamide acyltransferase (E2) component